MKKKLWLVLMVVFLAAFLAGCTEFQEPIYEDSEGFWNKFVVWPLVSLIIMFKGLLGTFGLAIIAVTILIRLAILPLMIKQVQGSKRMQEIQPEIKALQAKYPSKDAVTQKKYQEEFQQLLKTRNVNPAAGCLPVLVQMPILIGFYHAISRMNNTPEIALGSIFGVHLAEPSIILAFIAASAQFVVLRTGPAMGNPQMKAMMYFMPVMIFAFGTFLPSALTLYWIIGNIISFITNIFLYKPFSKKEKPEAATAAPSAQKRPAQQKPAGTRPAAQPSVKKKGGKPGGKKK
ncbi:membrane protein insertase YidC [Bhargavaea beijingensis]|uniref:Membrane protein insertase YidC n=1 Tax=Bhargavaea beijingensis TaxID=426756 RepID=A0A1G7ESZ8_9BACL|nr:membrane protein insertase YidC [Bhargavaea beijingensis]MCW1929063.1 membrane protein insertase YidC [Bhargavaea beijingensis]RSK34444.1 membrane protein insertase YidC [Bhargavaea beijingensis]SDE66737.1 YidC/Oxa1 family membrane protein insertase [Bhargavaea beijingensis]